MYIPFIFFTVIIEVLVSIVLLIPGLKGFKQGIAKWLDAQTWFAQTKFAAYAIGFVIASTFVGERTIPICCACEPLRSISRPSFMQARCTRCARATATRARWRACACWKRSATCSARAPRS